MGEDQINHAEHLANALQKLIDSVSYDMSGIMGQGGNGGLLSSDTVRASDEARLVLFRYRGDHE